GFGQVVGAIDGGQINVGRRLQFGLQGSGAGVFSPVDQRRLGVSLGQPRTKGAEIGHRARQQDDRGRGRSQTGGSLVALGVAGEGPFLDCAAAIARPRLDESSGQGGGGRTATIGEDSGSLQRKVRGGVLSQQSTPLGRR